VASQKTIRRFDYELTLTAQGIARIAGVDEAGRGPLAGPVFAAAVVFPAEWFRDGLPKSLEKINDSKQLTGEIREELFLEITSRREINFAIARVDSEMIDKINILQATHRAMNEALAKLSPTPEHVLVDGLHVKSMKFPQTPVVGGDARSYSIGAASILAKVSRDRLMLEMDARYPDYHFARHKGYGTPEHLDAIKKFGPCPIHRKSFAPMRAEQKDLF